MKKSNASNVQPKKPAEKGIAGVRACCPDDEVLIAIHPEARRGAGPAVKSNQFVAMCLKCRVS